MTPKQIKKVLRDTQGSDKSISTMLGVNPCTIHRWISGGCKITERHKVDLETLSQLIDSESKNKNITKAMLIKVVVLLMRANLWKDWDSFSRGEIKEVA